MHELREGEGNERKKNALIVKSCPINYIQDLFQQTLECYLYGLFLCRYSTVLRTCPDVRSLQ